MADLDNMHGINRRSFVKGSAFAAAAILTGAMAGCASAEDTDGEATSATTAASGKADAASSAADAKRSSSAASSADAAASSNTATASGAHTLLLFFSRAGENYTTNGPVATDIGNTAVVAGYIKDALGDAIDVVEIKSVEEYPYDYNEMTEVGKTEQDEDARPEIANADDIPDVSAYDTIILGSGIWWGRPPMIMRTLCDTIAADAAGKTIIPLTTAAGSGLGGSVDDYTDLLPDATVDGDRGFTTLGQDVANARGDVESWLSEIGLLQA